MDRNSLWVTINSAYVRANYLDAAITRGDIMKWLKSQPVYQKMARAKIPRAHTSLMDIQAVRYMSCDLTGPLNRDRGRQYIFGICDVALQKLYTRPIRVKKATDVCDALKSIIEANPDMKLSIFHSDNGTEFQGAFSEYLKEINCKQLFSAPGTPWANRKECVWGYLKSMLSKYQIQNDTKAWVKVLPQLTDNINNMQNQSLKVTPNEAEESMPCEILEARSKGYGVARKQQFKTTFKVGDKVRLRLQKTGGYEKQVQTYSMEVYIVLKVIQGDTKLVTYKLTSDGVNQIKGTYNITDLCVADGADAPLLEQLEAEDEEVGERIIHDQREVDEMLLTTPKVNTIRETRHPDPDDDGEYKVKAILGTGMFGKVRKYLVKYVGYPKEASNWEPARHIKALKVDEGVHRASEEEKIVE